MQYAGEKQKTKKRKSGDGADEVYTTKWPHFQRLRFLDEFQNPMKSTSNMKVRFT